MAADVCLQLRTQSNNVPWSCHQAWHKTCPPLPADGLPANPGCDGFSGPSLRPAVFGSGGADILANVAVGGQAQPVWEDSEPDRWLDSASGKHISF